MMKPTKENAWDTLRIGIPVPEYDCIVPWGIRPDQLSLHVPSRAISFSEGGCWPQARFTLLGFPCLAGFNFVSSDDGTLSEVQYLEWHPRRHKRSFRRCTRTLIERLGRPNRIDMSRGQQRWEINDIVVENHLARTAPPDGGPGRAFHMFSILLVSHGRTFRSRSTR